MILRDFLELMPDNALMMFVCGVLSFGVVVLIKIISSKLKEMIRDNNELELLRIKRRIDTDISFPEYISKTSISNHKFSLEMHEGFLNSLDSYNKIKFGYIESEIIEGINKMEEILKRKETEK